MPSNSPGTSQSSTSSAPDFSTLPRGLLCRKGVPVARGTRLPSLRTPRDLTLGGAAKRTFTPNIPARREKKDEVVKNASGVSASDRGRGSRRNQQFSGERGRGRGRGNIIQLQGSVFGDGIAAESGRRKGPFGQSTREPSSQSMPVPKFTPNSKIQTKEEKEEEEAKINELLRDDFIDDWDEDASKLSPVQLPLLVKEVKSESDIKPKLEPVKKEHLSDDDNEPMQVDGDIKPKVKKEEEKIVEPDTNIAQQSPASSVADLFTKPSIPEPGHLLFFQFPDCLPGASAKSDDDARIKKEPGTASTSSVNNDENGNCILADLPEGFIGKLQILKSGRTRLLLGPVCLNVEMGTPSGFLQDLVSLRIKEGTDPATGDMYVLGHVQDKLVCLPDMDSLLKNINKL